MFMMNDNQKEFNLYWDDVINAVYYKIPIVLKSVTTSEKLVNGGRSKITEIMQNEILNINFFDSTLRPPATVWMENLARDYPIEAEQIKRYFRSVKMPASGAQKAAYGTSLGLLGSGLFIGGRSKIIGAFLGLAGIASMGIGAVAGMASNTMALQQQATVYLENMGEKITSILAACDNRSDESGASEPTE